MSGDVLHSVSCDYITATAAETGGLNSLHSLGSALFRVQADRGNKVKPCGGSGFKGFQCGSVQVSTRDETCMVRLSSDSAASSWSRLFQLADNVTRLDVQVTIQTTDGVTERLSAYRDCALDHAEKHGNKPVVRWIRDNRRGYTLYLGGRQSLVFGRLYDKWADTRMDHYRDCFRAEVQFQGKLAKLVGAQLHKRSSPIPLMTGHVSRFFEARQVELGIQCEERATYSCSRPRSDVDKNLKWLTDAVRPTVLRLIASDRGEDVFRALGLVQDEQ